MATLNEFSARLSARSKRDYSPVSWLNFFDETHDILLDSSQLDSHGHCEQKSPTSDSQDSFRVYLRNFRPPFAPQRTFGQRLDLNKSECSQEELNQYLQHPTIVALHGGGYSALTWAQFSHYIEQQCQCRFLAIDLRSHGDTATSNDDQMDIQTLVSDVIRVTHAAHRLCGFAETPKIVLIGHSMGGAIAIKCSSKSTELMPSLVGFVIIDVVEGSAKDALPLMLSVIKARPTKFPTLSNAIEWSVRSGMAKNLDAARVSMPSNLLNITTGHLGIHDIDSSGDDFNCNDDNKATSQCPTIRPKKHKFRISLENLMTRQSMMPLPQGLPMSPRITSLRGSLIAGLPPMPVAAKKEPTVCEEELGTDKKPVGGDCETLLVTTSQNSEELDEEGYRRPPNLDQLSGYCWRTDLAKTQPFWKGWFDGLSQQLLDAPVQGKFLLLAGIDRLDKTLTIGQMQGKFMMKVLPKCGHAVHEDVPEQVASVVAQFLVRNRFATSTVV